MAIKVRFTREQVNSLPHKFRGSSRLTESNLLPSKHKVHEIRLSTNNMSDDGMALVYDTAKAKKDKHQNDVFLICGRTYVFPQFYSVMNACEAKELITIEELEIEEYREQYTLSWKLSNGGEYKTTQCIEIITPEPDDANTVEAKKLLARVVAKIKGVPYDGEFLVEVQKARKSLIKDYTERMLDLRRVEYMIDTFDWAESLEGRVKALFGRKIKIEAVEDDDTDMSFLD